MSVQVEKLEKNMAKLTVEVSAEDFEKAVNTVYNRNKKSINIPGFRKGKAPRVMIEKMYGAGVFFEDAANLLINTEYPKAAQESELDIVSRPTIDIVQIEKGKSFIFTAEVAVKPEVTLGEYKGVEVEVSAADVTEEEVAAELKKEQEKNSRTIDVDDRAVADGDMVTLDFEGFVDGVAFEGGKGTDYPLTIGSNSFIPGFEEQLVGATIGEEKEVPLARRRLPSVPITSEFRPTATTSGFTRPSAVFPTEENGASSPLLLTAPTVIIFSASPGGVIFFHEPAPEFPALQTTTIPLSAAFAASRDINA